MATYYAHLRLLDRTFYLTEQRPQPFHLTQRLLMFGGRLTPGLRGSVIGSGGAARM